ncbi:hypothetical protein ANANG_G00205830 [Anguilla anguilla]|uniref:Uncharacterized protein n=1 Tax=Anguilla anguilla TaxID=7936 RepID=A0A9D3RQJ2_ANGAN|nr:hypothetical protein ANANG_G00205830 [Anguilla anguilla]
MRIRSASRRAWPDVKSDRHCFCLRNRETLSQTSELEFTFSTVAPGSEARLQRPPVSTGPQFERAGRLARETRRASPSPSPPLSFCLHPFTKEVCRGVFTAPAGAVLKEGRSGGSAPTLARAQRHQVPKLRATIRGHLRGMNADFRWPRSPVLGSAGWIPR